MRYTLEQGIAESNRRITTRDYCIEDELLSAAGDHIAALEAENAKLLAVAEEILEMHVFDHDLSGAQEALRAAGIGETVGGQNG